MPVPDDDASRAAPVSAGRRAVLARPSRTGAVGAAVVYVAGLAPSLLPRPAVVQVGLGALLAALGYALGTAVGAGLRRTDVGRSRWQHAWTVVAVASWGVAGAMTAAAMSWQQQQAEALGVTPVAPSWWWALGGSVALAAVLVLLGRLLRALAGAVARRSARLPAPVPGLLGALVSGAVVAGVVVGGFLATKAVFQRLDGEVASPAPASTLRSGGPGSLVAWQSLGAEGRTFVSGGPTTADLDAFAERPAVEPIRVFAGLASAPTAEQRAALAVEELRRTGGLERDVVIAVVPTGNGFVDPSLAAAPEYLLAGDVATVGTQYSVLPSWLSSSSTSGRRPTRDAPWSGRCGPRSTPAPRATGPGC